MLGHGEYMLEWEPGIKGAGALVGVIEVGENGARRLLKLGEA